MALGRNAKRLAPVVLVALASLAVPAIAAKLKRPHEGLYTGDAARVQAHIWVDIVDFKPFKAAVLPQGPTLESGDSNTSWVVQAASCSDGSHQPFSVSPSRDLKISNRTGAFHDQVNTDTPLSNGGNITVHTKITGKVNGTRAGGTVEFSRVVNDPSSTFIPSCDSGGPQHWSAKLLR